ncbi:MAG: sulfatase-like hydrolase/transferase [Chitinophagaceae bacterium]|nr:sulfatase-like hydrolase/transferase [Chitinophagaceae bacterium]
MQVYLFWIPRLNYLKSAQRDALEWVDMKLGIIFNLLSSHNNNTLVIVCSDHGEEFGEGGRFGHSHNHETVLQVPIWVGFLKNFNIGI